MLAECGGVVKDTPRQDILPRLEPGLLAPRPHAARGSLFPQPWLGTGTGTAPQRMDALYGNGWRLVLAAGTAVPREAAAMPGLRVVHLGMLQDAEGVAATWFLRQEAVAALVRPDNYVFGVAQQDMELGVLLDELAAALGFVPA